MMLSTAAGNATSLKETGHGDRKSRSVVSKKIWLPKLIYSAVPMFYFLSGVAAFLATVYINEWFWVLPHYVLFSAVCLHLGFFVYRKRRHKAVAAESDSG